MNLFWYTFRSIWCHWARQRSFNQILHRLDIRSKKCGSKRKVAGFQCKRGLGALVQIFEPTNSKWTFSQNKWYQNDEKNNQNHQNSVILSCFCISTCYFWHVKIYLDKLSKININKYDESSENDRLAVINEEEDSDVDGPVIFNDENSGRMGWKLW